MGAIERILRQSAEQAAKVKPPAAHGLLDGLAGKRPQRMFLTERAGSQYVVNDDGTTVRTKAASEWHPDHQDSGQKDRSSQTFYLPEQASVLAQRAYASGRSPLSGQPLTRLVVRDGQPVLMRMQFERAAPAPESNLPGRPLKELGYAEIPLQTVPAPDVGLSPLEFFEDGRFHLGSKITEIR